MQKINTQFSVQNFKAPFAYTVVDEFFSHDFYLQMVCEFKNLLAPGLRDELTAETFSKPMLNGLRLSNDPDVHMFPVPHIEAPSFNVFLSSEYHEQVQRFLGKTVGQYVAAALHHHEANSPSSSVHSDYNLCNFKTPKIEAEGPIAYSGGTIYQYAYDTSHDITHCCRDVGMIFYLNNDDWVDGGGGETGLYDLNKNLVAKVAPKSNRLLLFKVTPTSYHSFLATQQFTRDNVAIWFHKPLQEILKEFRAKPNGLPPEVYQQMMGATHD